jgi:hypothetical protein
MMRRAIESLVLFVVSMVLGASVVWGFYLITECARRA